MPKLAWSRHSNPPASAYHVSGLQASAGVTGVHFAWPEGSNTAFPSYTVAQAQLTLFLKPGHRRHAGGQATLQTVTLQHCWLPNVNSAKTQNPQLENEHVRTRTHTRTPHTVTIYIRAQASPWTPHTRLTHPQALILTCVAAFLTGEAWFLLPTIYPLISSVPECTQIGFRLLTHQL